MMKDMTAKEFIEDWYGTPIPPDWDLEHEPLQNLSINDLERILKQYTLSIFNKVIAEVNDEGIEAESHSSAYVCGYKTALLGTIKRVKTLIGE